MRSWILLLLLCACHKSTPETPAALAQRGVELHRTHDYEKAIDCYRRSLALHEDTGVRVNLARALAAGRKFPEAADQYKQLLAGDPSNGALWHDYGIVLESGIKDLKAAEEALFNATKYPPRPPEASYDLGRVLMRLQRYEEAAACFEAAINLAPPKATWLQDAQDQQVQAYLLARKLPPPK
jgi:tetratricopeptide (TPR) repeat protein